MKIEHFDGSLEVSDTSSLEKALAARSARNANEFWLCGNERYPLLAIMICETLACLHYFPTDGHPGFISVAKSCKLPQNVTVLFYTNTADEEIEVASESAVPLQLALEAAREFFVSKNIPRCVDWVEL